MPKSVLEYMCFAVVFSLAACGKSSSGPLNPPVEDKNATHSYSQLADLHFAQIGTDLSELRDSSVTLAGTGTNSSYLIRYRFNSGDQNSFKIIGTISQADYSNCPTPDYTLTLQGPNMSKEINVLTQVPLTPKTDYELDVLAKHSCQALTLTFNLLAWLGNPAQDPKVGMICVDAASKTMTFIDGVNGLSAFNAAGKFLDLDTYCGEKLDGLKHSGCMTSDGSMTSSTGLFPKQVDCNADDGTTKLNSSAIFDSKTATATISCSKNAQGTYSSSLHSCRTVVLDYTPFH